MSVADSPFHDPLSPTSLVTMFDAHQNNAAKAAPTFNEPDFAAPAASNKVEDKMDPTERTS